MSGSISARSTRVLVVVVTLSLVILVAKNINSSRLSNQSLNATATPTVVATYVHGNGPSSASSPIPIVAGATRQYYFPVVATPNPNVTEEERMEHLRSVRSYFICSAEEAIAFVKEQTNTDNWKQYVAKRTSLIQLERWQDGLDPIDPALENSPLVWIVGFEAESNLAMSNIYGWLPGEHPGISTSPYMRVVFSEDKRVISAGGDEPIYSRESNEPIFRYSGFEAFPDLPSQVETQEPYFSGICAVQLQ